jgi:hypothetical protein
MKLIGWLAVELALVAFFVVGYVLYGGERSRGRERSAASSAAAR